MSHRKAFFLAISSALMATACGTFLVEGADGGSSDDASVSTIDANTPDGNGQGEPDAGTRCGNNALEIGEDCDDGNIAYGDGCSSDCKVEEQCVITHNGGSPLSLSSIKVAKDGTFSVVGTTTLNSNDSSDLFDERQGVTSCGTHVYAAPASSGAIAHLESQPDGSLDFVDATIQQGLFSVHCLAGANTLIALSLPPSDSATMNLVSYAIAPNGALTQVSQQPLTFSNVNNATFRNLVPAVVHPTAGDLWVVGYFESGFVGGGDSRAFRIAPDGNGGASVLEGPLDIGGFDVGRQIDIGNGGTQMVMAGLSGGCTGAWTLPSSGILPQSDLTQCSGNFGNGESAAARRADRVFYQGHSGASVRIHDVANGNLTFEGAVSTNSGARVLDLLYDDTVLFTVGRNDGDINVFNASPDGRTLARVPGAGTIPVSNIQSTTTVFCR